MKVFSIDNCSGRYVQLEPEYLQGFFQIKIVQILLHSDNFCKIAKSI